MNIKELERQINEVHEMEKFPVLLIGINVARELMTSGFMRNPGREEDQYFMGARVVINRMFPDKCEVVTEHEGI